MDFAPIIFTTSGGMGEQFQGQYWNSHWSRVEGQDEAMKVGPWVPERGRRFWQARFAVAVAKAAMR
jgi:hypothetical protein